MAPNLDAKFINPFVIATIDVIEIMAGLRPERKGLHIKSKNEYSFGDISGIIGFAGDIVGNLAVSFPKDVAISVISKMVGETPEFESKLLKEGVSEISNMIVGSAKGKLSQSIGCKYSLSIPTVITGKNHYIGHPSNMTVIVVNFIAENIGEFTVELCLKKD
ncbi:MAG: hypothetical protein ACD_79C01080G0004 [uncultured bacterium]|nr:MAG: hypothetical protein ACD_79C01080G0004 [uncultured bacterium]